MKIRATPDACHIIVLNDYRRSLPSLTLDTRLTFAACRRQVRNIDGVSVDSIALFEAWLGGPNAASVRAVGDTFEVEAGDESTIAVVVLV